MLPLDRTHPARRDLDWLPGRLRALRLTATGAMWSGVAAGAVALTVASGGALGHLAALAAAGGFYAGHRAAHALVRARLRRLARGLDLAELPAEEDGQLCHVRGLVRPLAPLASFLHGAPGVYRRLVFVVGGTMIHEAAVDFDLVDEAGELVRIEVAGARLLAPDLERADYPAARFVDNPATTPSLDAALAPHRDRLGPGAAAISATESLLRAGEAVEIVGVKSRAVDERVLSRLPRDTPMRASLRSGRALPLLITPLDRRPVDVI